MAKTSETPATRYLIAKDYVSVSGRQVWGVFDDVEKKIIESGFFSKAAARDAADRQNAEAR